MQQSGAHPWEGRAPLSLSSWPHSPAGLHCTRSRKILGCSETACGSQFLDVTWICWCVQHLEIKQGHGSRWMSLLVWWFCFLAAFELMIYRAKPCHRGLDVASIHPVWQLTQHTYSPLPVFGKGGIWTATLTGLLPGNGPETVSAQRAIRLWFHHHHHHYYCVQYITLFSKCHSVLQPVTAWGSYSSGALHGYYLCYYRRTYPPLITVWQVAKPLRAPASSSVK